MNQSTPPPAKASFKHVLQESRIGYPKLLSMGEEAKIPRSIIAAMVIGNPVPLSDAIVVLTILSRHTGKTWNLDTVSVSTLIPTFQDLYAFRRFDTLSLSQQSGVPLTTVDQMLCNEKVARSDAIQVLQTLSLLSGQNYTRRSM